MRKICSRRSARRRLIVSATGLLTFAGTHAFADPLYWDPTNTNGTNGGGGGTWDLNAPSWFDNNSSTEVAWNNNGQTGSPDDAFFGGATGGNISLATNINANTLTFNTSGYVLSGGSLSLFGGAATTFSTAGGPGTATITTSAGTANVTVATGITTTINSPFGSAGSNLLTLDGGGTLVLGGQSNYSGTTSILSGTLQIATTNALPTTTNVYLGANQGTSVTLNLNGFDQTITGLSALSGSTSGGATDTIVIGSGNTLNITGTASTNMYFGAGSNSTPSGTLLTNVDFVGPSGLGGGDGGNLTINASYSNGTPTFNPNIGIGFEIGNRGGSATIDMRDLASFTASLGTLEVGDYNTAQTGKDLATFYLAPISDIQVSTLRIGADSAGEAGSVITDAMYLGNTSNLIWAQDIRVGVMSGTSTTNARASGLLQFNGGSSSSGSITILNFAGGSSYGALGPTLYQIETGAATSNNLVSTVDFSGHLSQLNFQQMILAYRGSGTSSTASGTQGATATFTFDPPASDTSSYLNALNYTTGGAPAGASVVLGDRFSYGGNILATLNISGNPAVPVRLGQVTMGTNTSANTGKPGTSTGQLNIAGANVQIDSIQMADSSESGNLNDSSNGILNITGGTVQMVNGSPGTFGNGTSIITRANAGGQENTTITITGGGVLDMNSYAIGSSSAPIGSGTGSAMNFGSTPVVGFGASSTLMVGTLKNLSEFNGGTTPLNQATAGGTLILAGNNTYSGGTVINAGTILANSPAGSWSTGSGPVNIFSIGLLAGTGHIGGPLAGGPAGADSAAQVIVNAGSGGAGGTISAGSGASSADSVGLLTVSGGDGGATTYSIVLQGGTGGTGGTYAWKVNAANSTNLTPAQSSGVGTTDPAGAGTNWDMLSIGTLNVAAASGSPFNVQIVPIGSSATSFNPSQSYTWTIADVTGGTVRVNGITYNGNSASVLANLQAALQASLALNPAALPAPSNNFSFMAVPDQASGDDIVISYSPAPEPGSLALLGCGAAGIMMRRRRRSDS